MPAAPSVPYRLEFSVDVPGTQEQVWRAIATARGISSWFLPTRLDERESGALHFSMGPEMGSDGRVTAWEPPRRFAYEEDWASLMGKGDDELSPMTTEFVVAPLPGGSCSVQVTTSGYGTGAEWEADWWQDMGTQWQPYFENLRVYLEHFAGQDAVNFEATATHQADADALWTVFRDTAGITEEGTALMVRGATAVVEKLGERRALVRLIGPVPGLLSLLTYSYEPGEAIAGVRAYLFAADAGAYAEAEERRWRGWLEELRTG